MVMVVPNGFSNYILTDANRKTVWCQHYHTKIGMVFLLFVLFYFFSINGTFLTLKICELSFILVIDLIEGYAQLAKDNST